MSYPRANRIGKRRRPSKTVVRIAAAVVILALVGVGTYLFVERRQEIEATQASYRNSLPAAPTTTTARAATPTPAAAPVDAPAATTAETPAPEPAPAPAPVPEPAPASVEPAAISGQDQTYLDLLSASGYPVDAATSRVYVDRALAACQALRDGEDGQAVVDSVASAAESAGLTADQGEGVVYIGVASYCNEVADQLP